MGILALTMWVLSSSPSWAVTSLYGYVRPSVGAADSTLIVSSFDSRDGTVARASNASESAAIHTYRMRTQCQVTDPALGSCRPGEVQCALAPERLIAYYVVDQRRLVQEDHSAVDALLPDPAGAPGTAYGPWTEIYRGCVDVTDVNPPPSPEEVYRYFQTIPLPVLTAQHQPPGNGLVNLPVIFYTDPPDLPPVTVLIRGFTVVITPTPTTYTWHTGDGTDLVTTVPGAPYPDQTVTHNYASGTYTTGLTVTWGGTYTVNGGAPTPIAGTTTTDSATDTFDVLQAHAVLTDPYD